MGDCKPLTTVSHGGNCLTFPAHRRQSCRELVLEWLIPNRGAPLVLQCTKLSGQQQHAQLSPLFATLSGETIGTGPRLLLTRPIVR